jgi:hypothetical protein
MLCSTLKIERHFWGTCYLNLQGSVVRQVRKKIWFLTYLTLGQLCEEGKAEASIVRTEVESD